MSSCYKGFLWIELMQLKKKVGKGNEKENYKEISKANKTKDTPSH